MITIETVKARLNTLGITLEESDDDYLIGYIITAKENHIKNVCNLSEIPEELENKAIDMVCGEYLLTVKGSGRDIAIDINSAVSSISEGDTSVTISDGMKTPEQRLDELINSLSDESGLKGYRKIRW